MGPYDYLRELHRYGFQGVAFDIPFLIRAMEDGVVKEGELLPAVALLDQEVRLAANFWPREEIEKRFSLLISDAHKSVQAPDIFDQWQAASLLQTLTKASDLIAELSKEFPETADTYRAHYRSILQRYSLSQYPEKRVTLLRDLMNFIETMQLERRWQKIFESQYENTIYLGALQLVDPSAWFSIDRTYDYLNNMGADKKHSLYTPAHDQEALAIQVPLLGAVLMARLGEERVRNLKFRAIGESVVIDAPGLEMPAVIKTPLYQSLDKALMVMDIRSHDERLVSLPVRRKIIGEHWQHVEASPFFLRHDEHLLPSNYFVGGSFSLESPKYDALDIFVAHQMPPSYRVISHDQVRKILPDQKVERHSVFATDRSQLLHVYVLHGDHKTRYQIVIEYGRIDKQSFLYDVGLRLDIRQGALVGAQYLINGNNPLIVELDEKRLKALIARAKKGFVPNPEGGMVGGSHDTGENDNQSGASGSQAASLLGNPFLYDYGHDSVNMYDLNYLNFLASVGVFSPAGIPLSHYVIQP